MLSRRTLLATTAALPFVTSVWGMTLDDQPGPHVHRDSIVAWGDRVEPDSPAFTPATLSAEAASRQFGWDAILLGVMPQAQGEDGVARAIMVVAHPAPAVRMLPPDANTPAVLAGLQGASILNIEQHNGRWLVTDGGFQTRRLNGETLCRISGSGGAGLGDASRGIVDPSCGGIAPWGRALVGEMPVTEHSGFVVEFDPTDPDNIPTKRTSLGRFPRAGLLAVQAQDGRAIVFMSEDGGQERLFRFISSAPLSADNPDALDQGQLQVAVLHDDLLQFIPFSEPGSGSSLGAPAGLARQADGTILLACRGHQGDGAADELASGNPDGRILLLRPQGDDGAHGNFSVELALIGGDTGSGTAVVRRPACLGIGPAGHVWIGADGTGVAMAEASFTKVTQLYGIPVGAVVGGIAFSPDGFLAMAAVRHPGLTAGSSWAYPATRWPTLRPDMPPQSVIVGLSLAN